MIKRFAEFIREDQGEDKFYKKPYKKPSEYPHELVSDNETEILHLNSQKKGATAKEVEEIDKKIKDIEKDNSDITD